MRPEDVLYLIFNGNNPGIVTGLFISPALSLPTRSNADKVRGGGFYAKISIIDDLSIVVDRCTIGSCPIDGRWRADCSSAWNCCQ